MVFLIVALFRISHNKKQERIKPGPQGHCAAEIVNNNKVPTIKWDTQRVVISLKLKWDLATGELANQLFDVRGSEILGYNVNNVVAFR